MEVAYLFVLTDYFVRSLRESNPRKRFCRASAKPLTQETKPAIFTDHKSFYIKSNPEWQS